MPTSALAAPTVTLSTTSGSPTTSVTVTGAGFPASQAIDVFFDTGDVALATSNASGAVSATIAIPASAQPGLHWITLEQLGTYAAAQESFSVGTNWPAQGFGTSSRSFNPFENTIDTSNVDALFKAWTVPAGGFGNPSPFIYFDSRLYLIEVSGNVYDYSSSGKLQWTAKLPGNFGTVTPAAAGGYVVFGASNGDVYGFPATCRSDGGVCTPTWTVSVGSSVTGALSVRNGMVYVPSSDKTFHVLNPASGAAGTSIQAFDANAPDTPIAFETNGAFYYGAGSNFEYNTPSSSGTVVESGTVSPAAIYNGAAYFTTGDGTLHQFGNANWSAGTSSGGCAPAPAVAENVVYAGGCSNLEAVNAGDGSVLWNVKTPGGVVGLSVANGVLYACVDTGSEGQLLAYAASYGGELWSGGGCTGTPVVVNGAVYGALAELSAYNLVLAAGASRDSGGIPPRPNPRALRPSLRLHPNLRRHGAHLPRRSRHRRPG